MYNSISIAHGQCGSVVQLYYCLAPQGSAVVYRKSPTAHCPQAMWRHPARVPLLTAVMQCGTLPQEFHWPVTLGSAATYCSRSTAHCPLVVR